MTADASHQAHRPYKNLSELHEIKFDGYRMQLRTGMAPPPCGRAKGHRHQQSECQV